MIAAGRCTMTPPTLNSRGEPIDVFESTVDIALMTWSASVERAAAVDIYAGLLTSLHVLALSAFVSSQPSSHFDLKQPANRFELNKFQHRQIELQEGFRKQLGMSNDLPLHHGLAENSTDPAEQSLMFELRMLQAMDQLSLAACCTKPPFPQIKPVLARPGGRAMALRVQRPNETTVHVSPWPFAGDKLVEEVPYRIVSSEPFKDSAALAAEYAAATIHQMTLTFLPGR